MNRHSLCAVLLVLLAVGGMAFAQEAAKKDPGPPPTVTKVVHGQLGWIESEFVPAAEAMPEDKFDFAPSHGEFKGVRTYLQQIKHVAAVNYMIGAAILEEKIPIDIGTGENGPDSIKTKADAVKFLKDSFAYVHKAMDAVKAENATAWIKSPFGDNQTTRLAMASSVVAHCFDHYGQMVVYLRMNGVIPPASRPQQR
ncbi:MAG TPA: DinB family protein [Terriglobales bacterium]|nr:DinB family protein [Terriglobales bacterium]